MAPAPTTTLETETKLRHPVRGSVRRALRVGLGAVGALLLVGVGAVAVLGCSSFGQSPSGARLARVEASPHFVEGEFQNPQPMQNDMVKAVFSLLDTDAHVTPDEPLHMERDPAIFAGPPASGLRVTWFGHSTSLIELDGKRLLTDPIWSERASPVGFLGPSRFSVMPFTVEELPPLDAVLVSHNHYDHLDRETIQRLVPSGARFFVPLGLGETLVGWGVPEERVEELDWWQEKPLGPLRVVSVPARHASGRHLTDDGDTFWTGWAVVGSERVYYSGDTGLFPAMREIGARLGPFDVTLIEVGQYGQSWPDWHLGPEQAVRAHQMVQGKLMLPVHWAAFALAMHGWTEPIERTLAAAAEAQVKVATPRLGQSFEPAQGGARSRWWPELPFRTGDQDPIVASQVD